MSSAWKARSRAPGIGHKAYYRTPVHRQPPMRAWAAGVELPATEHAAQRHLAIPMSPLLTRDQADEVVAAVRAPLVDALEALRADWRANRRNGRSLRDRHAVQARAGGQHRAPGRCGRWRFRSSSTYKLIVEWLLTVDLPVRTQRRRRAHAEPCIWDRASTPTR